MSLKLVVRFRRSLIIFNNLNYLNYYNLFSLNTSKPNWLFDIKQTLLFPNFFFIYKNNQSYDDYRYTIKLYPILKELYYTKLKYSRVPQFDTSAGAVASFISGMYGFMVCEKFGFELLDSGDFLFLLLYLIAVVFVVSVLFNVANSKNLNILSLLLLFKF